MGKGMKSDKLLNADVSKRCLRIPTSLMVERLHPILPPTYDDSDHETWSWFMHEGEHSMPVCMHHADRPYSSDAVWTSDGPSGRLVLMPPFRMLLALRSGGHGSCRIPAALKPSGDRGPAYFNSRNTGSSVGGGGNEIEVACLSRKGFAPGYKEDNQDCAFALDHWGRPGLSLLGVFDGHGRDGHHVSRFIADRLPSAILGRLSFFTPHAAGSSAGSTAGNPAAPRADMRRSTLGGSRGDGGRLSSTVGDDSAGKGGLKWALAAAFGEVNQRLETPSDHRGRGCGGCAGERCGGRCRPPCGFDAYNAGSTAVVAVVDKDAGEASTGNI